MAALTLSSGCKSDELERFRETMEVAMDTTRKSISTVEEAAKVVQCVKDKTCPAYPSEPQTFMPLYRVWYGTNRQPLPTGAGFSNHRDNILRYGWCLVEIPESHQFGSIGSSWIVRTVKRTDDRLKLHSIDLVEEKTFYEQLSLQLAGQPTGRTVLVYIHGYNVSFEDAAKRAAQIGYDLKLDGAMAFFSWPAKGEWWGYSADEATIDVIEDTLKEFLVKLTQQSGAEELHLISHSMGNRALLRVMESLSRDKEFLANKRFGQIVLAAPDVDIDQFQRLAKAYTGMGKRTTLYMSPMDLALRASSVIHGYPRVGFFPPITVLPHIDTIKVENFDLNLLGHDYYASAEALLYDISQLIKTNADPDIRPRLKRYLTPNMLPYWQIN
jgi:esterase/lipase superfamily enzyme